MSEVAFWISYGLLWALTIVLTAAVTVLLRHYGDVLAPVAKPSQGPAEETPLPERLVHALADHGVPIGAGESPAKLIVFVSSSCAPCTRVRDILRGSPDLFARGVEIVTVCRGPAPEVLEYSSGLPQRVRVVLDAQGKLGDAFRVSTAPFAVSIDSTGYVRAKGIPATHEAFVALMESVQPPLQVSMDAR